jgi:phosphoribosylaminoimidazolecarboxamide formyltransferase/IMP cyclohydrolase
MTVMRKLALISVSNKTHLKTIASGLAHRNWNIISTGGTYNELRKLTYLKDHLKSVEDHCKSQEFLGGRVKTLNEVVHGGILARSDQLSELITRGISPIDMIVCNLYPFEKVISDPSTTYDEAIENIDIGGVTMLRGAAKNHKRVSVVTDPSDYTKILELLDENGNEIPVEHRSKFALKAFKTTAQYDSCVSEYLSKGDFTVRMYNKTNKLKYGLHL